MDDLENLITLNLWSFQPPMFSSTLTTVNCNRLVGKFSNRQPAYKKHWGQHIKFEVSVKKKKTNSDVVQNVRQQPNGDLCVSYKIGFRDVISLIMVNNFQHAFNFLPLFNQLLSIISYFSQMFSTNYHVKHKKKNNKWNHKIIVCERMTNY